MFHLLSKEVVLELLCYNYNNFRECNKSKKKKKKMFINKFYVKNVIKVFSKFP